MLKTVFKFSRIYKDQEDNRQHKSSKVFLRTKLKEVLAMSSYLFKSLKGDLLFFVNTCFI